jgi:deazaflavin-dependent oxidoreductase (nitroreductase family)
MSATGYVKPPWAARVVGARLARLFKPKIVQVLSVPGRRSGEWRTVSVAVLTHNGHEYLLSAYGQTDWSRNLRASGRARLSRRGGTEEIAVEEVPADDLPPLIDDYLRQFGKLPNVAKTFAALPHPTDHSAFRITSARAIEPS